MATTTPLFTAVSSSARQILLLLRCISFAQKAHVRITSSGLRLSTEDGSIMEASIFLDKALFSSYTYSTPSALDGETLHAPEFEINIISLLETLNIFSLSDPAATKRPGLGGDYESFAAHRLNRHANINAFANQPLGMTGICTISYEGAGSPLNIHMAESGVTTTCQLTTYEASDSEEIPFKRDNLALKTIMRANHLLDAITELGSMSPTNLTIIAKPLRSSMRATSSAATTNNLSLSASGPLGSVAVDFAAGLESMHSDAPPLLETFHCPQPTDASFHFRLVKHAQRAMLAATKVSLRLDDEGVLSMQFLVEVNAGGGVENDRVAFVDFRIVPLVDGEMENDGRREDDSTDEE